MNQESGSYKIHKLEGSWVLLEQDVQKKNLEKNHLQLLNLLLSLLQLRFGNVYCTAEILHHSNQSFCRLLSWETIQKNLSSSFNCRQWKRPEQANYRQWFDVSCLSQNRGRNQTSLASPTKQLVMGTIAFPLI